MEKEMEKQDLAAAALAVDLCAPHFDIVRYEAALSVRSILHLVLYGGSPYGRSDQNDAYFPASLVVLINCGLVRSKQTGMFLQAWEQLQDYMPSCTRAWEQGQETFKQHLQCYSSDPNDLGYLGQVDFALDCYACISGRELYPKSECLRNWFVNGYMLSWRKRFLGNDVA